MATAIPVEAALAIKLKLKAVKLLPAMLRWLGCNERIVWLPWGQWVRPPTVSVPETWRSISPLLLSTPQARDEYAPRQISAPATLRRLSAYAMGCAGLLMMHIFGTIEGE